MYTYMEIRKFFNEKAGSPGNQAQIDKQTNFTITF